MSKNRYSETYKQVAVERVQAGEKPVALAKELGASAYSIRDWVKAAETAARERPATAAELSEIKRLKREISQLKEDNTILKKATALFAKERL